MRNLSSARVAKGLSRGVCSGALALALLAAGPALSPRLAAAAAQPGFVIQAENDYRQARQTVATLQHELDQLNQQKTKEGRRALAKQGQWIEPAGLWRKTRAVQQKLAFARVRERHARTALNVARDTARTERVGGFPQGEFQPFKPFWWW